jgi:spermidine synthase
MKKSLIFSVIVNGATAMAAQIILVRELLGVFYGNELSIGFILASWLAGGGLGAAAFAKLSRRSALAGELFIFCQIAVAVLAPLAVLAVRFIRPALAINPGQILPFSIMAIGSIAILVPVCAVMAFSFVLACRIYDSRSGAAVRIGRIYILEAMGAMAGGLIVSFFLIRVLSSFQIAAIIGILNAAAAYIYATSAKDIRYRTALIVIPAALLAFYALSFSSGSVRCLEERTIRMQWPGYTIIESGNSIYGNVSLVERLGQDSFFDNGLYLYTVGDKMTSEEAVHFALLEHPAPQSMLMIGGGVGGLAAEALKHPLKELTYIELDPLIIQTAIRRLAPDSCGAVFDPRVRVEHADARAFIKRSRRQYDCIVVHLGDPYTAQLNRYYTQEFFREVKNALSYGGVLSFSLTGSESFMNKDTRTYLGTIYGTLRSVFADVLVIPGETIYFLASNTSGVLDHDYNLLMSRAKERGVGLEYVREYYLFDRMSPEKTADLEKAIGQDVLYGGGINRDFRPIGYYYATISWLSRFKGSAVNSAMRYASGIKTWIIIFFAYVCALAAAFFAAPRKRRFNAAAIIAVMTTGFSEMSFQVIVLVSFQVIYGYMFYKLGVILTSFMAGLVLGSSWILRSMPEASMERPFFIRAQAAISVYPMILPLLLWYFAQAKSQAAVWLGANVVFPLLPVAAGFIGGAQFPLAVKIYHGADEDAGMASGANYGVDLVGSCLGAFLTGAFLIPVIGIPFTCFSVALVNAIVLVLLIIGDRHAS